MKTKLPLEHPLAQGLEMTRKMLELVRAGEWQEVTELAKIRHRVLQQYNIDSDPSNAQTYLGILQEIQSLDGEIETLSRESKEEAAEQLRQIHQGRKADKAYRR